MYKIEMQKELVNYGEIVWDSEMQDISGFHRITIFSY